MQPAGPLNSSIQDTGEVDHVINQYKEDLLCFTGNEGSFKR
jgi:hypothetical protein